jgi:hypothetical protein
MAHGDAAEGRRVSIPVNGEARKVAASWNLEAEQRERQSAARRTAIGGIIRQPGRLAHLVAGRSDAQARVRCRHADALCSTSIDPKQAPAEKTHRKAFSNSRNGKARRGRGAGPAVTAVRIRE